MGTPLGPKYIPYTYMDPLGSILGFYIYRRTGLGPQVGQPAQCILQVSKGR